MAATLLHTVDAIDITSTWACPAHDGLVERASCSSLKLLGGVDSTTWVQARASWARVTGMSEEDVERLIWTPHHTWAGEELYSMCIDLRGFYTKVGWEWR